MCLRYFNGLLFWSCQEHCCQQSETIDFLPIHSRHKGTSSSAAWTQGSELGKPLLGPTLSSWRCCPQQGCLNIPFSAHTSLQLSYQKKEGKPLFGPVDLLGGWGTGSVAEVLAVQTFVRPQYPHKCRVPWCTVIIPPLKRGDKKIPGAN